MNSPLSAVAAIPEIVLALDFTGGIPRQLPGNINRLVTGSPHVPGASAIGAAFGAMENLVANLAFEVSPLGVSVCLRTLANVDSRSIQDTVGIITSQLSITKDQAIALIAQSSLLKVPATVTDTANSAVLIASDRTRIVTGTVVNATAGATLD